MSQLCQFGKTRIANGALRKQVCREPAVKGGTYCESHREAAMARVEKVRDDRVRPWPKADMIRLRSSWS